MPPHRRFCAARVSRGGAAGRKPKVTSRLLKGETGDARSPGRLQR
uniref:Uncharacterized protein n=1 Tax=Nonomuraea gerenzanensis TaxID=93944 RepID=A0A1M4E4E3_9ACTN|nr:hypothetical protein BN4615_P3142 [Nonomuraea gerenzanensis]